MSCLKSCAHPLFTSLNRRLRLLSFNSISRAVGDKRNWSAFALAGATVFLGVQVLEAFQFKNAASLGILIVLAAFVARPLLRV